MNDKGWVSLHRKLCDHKLWFSEPFTKAQAWVDLFMNCNHDSRSWWLRGIEVKLKRGQIAWSELTMTKRWRWSKNKVRRFLKWLETEQQISQVKTPITSIITILNYNAYQSELRKTKQQTKQQKDNNRYTNNNDNNNNNNNLINEAKEINSRVFNEIVFNFAKLKNKDNPESSDYSETRKLLKTKDTDSFKNDGLDQVRKLLLLWQILAAYREKILSGKYYPYIKTIYENSSYSDYQKILNNPFNIKYEGQEEMELL